MSSLRARLGRLLRDERGFTLVELTTVLGMLVIVMTCLAYAMIAADKAEEEMRRRFASQINARIALDQLRREIHCASSVPLSSSASVTIVLGSRCPTASGGSVVSWCTVGSGTRFSLYRQTGTTCSSAGRKSADYLTTGAVFAFIAQSTSSLAILSVSLPVDTNPAGGQPDYRLADDIVLRNSTRT